MDLPPRTRLFCAAIIGASLCACQGLPPAKAPAPPLTMVRSGDFTLPSSCEAGGSVVVDYTVYEDGQTGNINVPSAPPCLQQALTQWVASFRYTPQSARVPASIEWLLVTANKGS